MSLWRSTNRATVRRAVKPGLVRLDDRIVPDTTGVTPTNPTEPPTTTNPPVIPGPTDPAPTGSDTTTTNPPPGNDTTTTTPGDDTTTTNPPPPAPQLYAVGSDPGNPARVIVYDNTGAKKHDFIAYQNYQGGVHATVADMNNDGVADIITAPGAGVKGTIKIFDGVTGQRIMSFDAYAPAFRGGVNIVAKDMNGDGRADIVTGPGEGGGSHVKIFNGAALFPTDQYAALQVTPGPNNYILRQFFAYNAKYPVGARIAVADVNNDGVNDIVTAPGKSGGPHIRVFSGADGTVYREWFAYDAKFTGGVFVSAGDLNGDGFAEVVTGMGLNGVGEVKVYEGKFNLLMRAFTPESTPLRVSSRVGVIDFDRDGDNDLMVATLNTINAYDGKTFVRVGGMMPFDPTHVGGVFFS